MGSGMSDDRSSVAASVAPSIAETASEGDWLMAAIVEDEAVDDADADGEDDDEGDQLHVSQITEPNNAATDSGTDNNTDGKSFYIFSNI
jgi:20S proteasome subunit alpha 6